MELTAKNCNNFLIGGIYEVLLMDHGQDHLKPLFCQDRMGDLCRHDDHLAFMQEMGRFIDGDLCFPVNDGCDRIEGCGMFRKTLAGIEGKERDGAGLFRTRACG